MSLLVDLFGWLSVVLHGFVIVTQSVAVGGALFLVFLARPFAERLTMPVAALGAVQVVDGEGIARKAALIAGWSALGLALCEAATVAMQGAVVADQVGLSASEVLGANFAIAGLVKMAAAFLLALCLLVPLVPARSPASAPTLIGLCAVILAAAVMTTHAAARIDDQGALMAATALHLLGAALWIGGIPSFVMALRGTRDDATALRLVGTRFSRMSMVGVACILASATIFSIYYIGSWQGLYGTAYGVMVGAKAAMFGALLLLGLGNLLVVERLRRDPATPALRLRRFAEVEIGVGFAIFFAAASLTSVPPAVDLTQDRVTLGEIAERNAPYWPRLTSPDVDSLALPALQQKLDREAARDHTAAAPAFVPGSGELPPRNAADIAWSEYNHHWAGLFVLLVGVLALLNRAGVRWARHWPLAFLGLAAFLFVRSDPEVWPLGSEGFFASLRDVEVAQHRVFVLLTIAFALFEWGVRTGRIRSRRAALVFPLLTAAGGTLLLTHSHAIANVKEQLLIELTHTPLALAGIAAGWARWLELRADGRVARVAGWVWPTCFALVGVILLWYREA
jgi:copper resistance protein D